MSHWHLYDLIIKCCPVCVSLWLPLQSPFLLSFRLILYAGLTLPWELDPTVTSWINTSKKKKMWSWPKSFFSHVSYWCVDRAITINMFYESFLSLSFAHSLNQADGQVEIYALSLTSYLKVYCFTIFTLGWPLVCVRINTHEHAYRLMTMSREFCQTHSTISIWPSRRQIKLFALNWITHQKLPVHTVIRPSGVALFWRHEHLHLHTQPGAGSMGHWRRKVLLVLC